MSEEPIPESLYKYRAATSTTDLERLSKIIVESEIYLGNSFEFNDIFDIRPAMHFECSDDELVTRLVTHWAKKLSKAALAQYEVQVRSAVGTCDDPRIEPRRGQLQDNFGKQLEAWGVFCATEKWNNLLMWSHYAGSFSGVCLEFRSRALGHFEKVIYAPDRPVIDGLPGGVKTVRELSLQCIFTKSIEWNYEKEWRAVGRKGPNSIPEDAIKSISFGPRCTNETRAKIIEMVRRSGKKIDFYSAIPSSRNFEIIRESL
jgi:hypothetical protein